MSDSYLSYIPCAHYGLKKQKRRQQKMAAKAATALVIAAQSIPIEFDDGDQRRDEGRAGIHFNIVELKFDISL